MKDEWTWVKIISGLLLMCIQNILQEGMHFKLPNHPKALIIQIKKLMGKKSTEEMNGEEECRYSTCAKYQGWSIEGIKRFNSFMIQSRQSKKVLKD